MIFTDRSSNFHPYECDGKGECVHCDREISTKHNPDTCALCDDQDGDLSDTARFGAGA